VNLDYINEYLDREKEPTIKVICIFLEQAAKTMEKLEKGIQSKNYEEITYASHFFKSTFITMGINCHKEICEIEELSRQNTALKEISKRLKLMMPAYNEAIRAYESILDNIQSE